MLCSRDFELPSALFFCCTQAGSQTVFQESRIIYYTADESSAGQADTVKFGKQDRFQFRSFDGDRVTDGQQSLRYIGGREFTGRAGELRYIGRGLQADTTGDGQADFVVNFAKATPWFSEANILL